MTRQLSLFGLLLIVTLIMNSCGSLLCDEKELYRVTSPDEKVDAILTRKNCGALVPFIYSIYIVPRNKLPKKSRPVFIAEHLVGERIEWPIAKRLEIKYAKAIIKEYSNLWFSRDIDNYKVEIRERALSEESAIDIGEGKELRK